MSVIYQLVTQEPVVIAGYLMLPPAPLKSWSNSAV